MAQFSKRRKIIKRFKHRLETRDCPLVDGVDETWLDELFFTPGEPRIRLLHWLFAKFDPQLNDVIDPPTNDSKMDSRLQRLLFAASTLGLCNSKDVELIRGTASVQKQVAFFEQLIDFVAVVHSAEGHDEMPGPSLVSDSAAILDQFHASSQFANSLASQENMTSLFEPQIDLLPLDLAKQVKRSWAEKGHKEKYPVPDMSLLTQKAADFKQDLERNNTLLAELKSMYECVDYDASSADKMNQTLRLVLSEFSQLMIGFSCCYENEMTQWCHKTPPQLTELGPVVKRTHTLLQQFVKLLESLTRIRGSHSRLTRDLKHSLEKIKEEETKLQGLEAQLSLPNIEQCVHVLNEALTREQN